MSRLRARAVQIGIAGALVLLVLPLPLYAQQFVSIFSGANLKGWRVEHTTAGVRDGVIGVGAGNGWVRTERAFSDFVLKLDVRLTRENATAGVFVRAWPTFDKLSTPTNGYRITVAPSPGFDGWRHLEVECVGHTLTVRLDGASEFTANTIDNPQGYLALGANQGAAEFKAIEIKELPVPRWDVPAGVFSKEDSIVFPRVRKEVKPRYTGEAMAAQISGAVLLTAVVLPDGTTDDVRVRLSLDPRLGLDREAIAAARNWRFFPGTREGQPVAVLVSIELTFTLK